MSKINIPIPEDIKWERMIKVYIGVDPGDDGFISVIMEKGNYKFLPINNTPIQEISNFLSWASAYDCVAVLEDVHAVFGSSAKGTFSFGFSKGMLLALLVAHQIRYVLVPPKDWQNEVWINADKEYAIQKQRTKSGEEKSVKKVNTKATSINAARRLFPTVDFRKSERAKKPHDGKVDALLMAEYARRKNL